MQATAKQQSDEAFRRQLSDARQWEIQVAAWARDRGYYVVPTYDFNGADGDKAPKLLAPPGCRDLVLPDLQCFKDNTIRWLEVKWKDRADVYRKGGYRVTGISLRLYDHYHECELRTGGEVFVVFLHQQEQEVRGDKLSALRGYESHRYTGKKMGRAGMVFWPYEQIPRWGRLDMIGKAA